MTPLTFQEILDNEVDPGSPMNQSLFLRLARNWEAAFGGAPGAPKLSASALGPDVSAGDLVKLNVPDLFISVNASDVVRVFEYTFVQSGSVRLKTEQRHSNGGVSKVAVSLSGVPVVDFEVQGSSWEVRAVDLAVLPGDRLTLDFTEKVAATGNAEVRNIALCTDGEALFPFSAVKGEIFL